MTQVVLSSSFVLINPNVSCCYMQPCSTLGYVSPPLNFTVGHNMGMGSYLKNKEEKFTDRKGGRREQFNDTQNNGLELSGFCTGYL